MDSWTYSPRNFNMKEYDISIAFLLYFRYTFVVLSARLMLRWCVILLRYFGVTNVVLLIHLRGNLVILLWYLLHG